MLWQILVLSFFFLLVKHIYLFEMVLITAAFNVSWRRIQRTVHRIIHLSTYLFQWLLGITWAGAMPLLHVKRRSHVMLLSLGDEHKSCLCNIISFFTDSSNHAWRISYHDQQCARWCKQAIQNGLCHHVKKNAANSYNILDQWLLSMHIAVAIDKVFFFFVGTHFSNEQFAFEEWICLLIFSWWREQKKYLQSTAD